MGIINNDFLEALSAVFNPRNAMYISRNDGKFNNDVNHQRDTIINTNTMVLLGRHVYSQQDINNILAIKERNRV